MDYYYISIVIDLCVTFLNFQLEGPCEYDNSSSIACIKL